MPCVRRLEYIEDSMAADPTVEARQRRVSAGRIITLIAIAVIIVGNYMPWVLANKAFELLPIVGLGLNILTCSLLWKGYPFARWLYVGFKVLDLIQRIVLFSQTSDPLQLYKLCQSAVVLALLLLPPMGSYMRYMQARRQWQ